VANRASRERGRGFRLLWLPPWRRAPLRLLGSAVLFPSIALAAFVLGVAGGSRPLFVSSASDAALRDGLTRGCPYDVGLRVQRQVQIARINESAFGIERRSAALRTAVADVPDVAAPVTTIYGGTWRLTNATSEDRTQLVSRTGAFDHVHVLASVRAPGIWLPDTVARTMKTKPGARVSVVGPSGVPVPLIVHAVFSDLTYVHRDITWCSLQRTFEPFQLYSPAPTALLDQRLMERVLDQMHALSAVTWWEYPPAGQHLTESQARTTIAGLQSVAAATNNLSLPVGRAFGTGGASVDSQGASKHAQDAGETASSSVGPVALGAAAVALLVLLLAARTWLDRRRQEIVILALRGAGPLSLAVKGLLELVVPVALGGAAGLGAGYLLVRTVGPSALVESGALGSAVVIVAVVLAIALVCAAIVIGFGVRRVGLDSESTARRVQLPMWEPIVLAVACAAYYELSTRSSTAEGARVDSLVLLFPVLLLAAGSGLLARVVLSPRVLRRGSGRAGTALWLGVRRVTAGRRRAVPVVTAAAVSIGIVVFSGTLAASLRATVHAKGTLGVGAAQALTLDHPQSLPPRSPLQPIATEVTRTTESTASPQGHEPADVLGVDPATFRRAAYFDASFANRSLGNLLARLHRESTTSEAPVIAVGAGLPDRFTLTLTTSSGDAKTLPVVVAARARAFPGYQFVSERPLVVIDRSILTRAHVDDTPQLWIGRDDVGVTREIAASGLSITAVVRAATLVPSQLEPQIWALQYLRVIGSMAGLVTLSGLGLYFAAIAQRRRMSSSLARRMGLSRRRAIGATATEIGAMLGVGLLFGSGLAFVAVRLVFAHVDLAPQIQPAPLFRFDFGSLLLCGAGVVVATAFVTALVEARAERASLPELLRHAG
jgi:putative ABC transport system permease protein